MRRETLIRTVVRHRGSPLWLVAVAVGGVLALTFALTRPAIVAGTATVPLAQRQKPVPTTTTPVATTTSTTPAPRISPCTILPADNIWHAGVSGLPVLPRSADYVTSIGANAKVHADFGAGQWDGGPIGIPVTYVHDSQPKVRVTFDYADESDPGPYPIPPDAIVESGDDRHVLVVDTDNCLLYELYDAQRRDGGSWHAGSGAIFPLRGQALRPAGWTSADAAGLPILPGLVRYDEVAAGHIDHAIRITVPRSQAAHLWPARHDAGTADAALPPMGLRLRLKAGVDLSTLPTQARIIAQAMKTQGVIVADNGSPWYIGGVPDPRWDDAALQALGSLHGSDFEAVDTAGLMTTPDSGRVRSR
jgi:hypothetical protein